MDMCVDDDDDVMTENPDLLASWTEDDEEDEKVENSNDIWQHVVALLIAGLAAVVAHIHMNGGYSAWRDALSDDWELLKAKLIESHAPTIYNGNLAPSAQPSFDLIPLEKRTEALDRAFGRVRSDHVAEPLSHKRARAFRRTRELKFCPQNGLLVGDIDGQQNLMEMEFILKLEPSVRILHSYYLADAFGTDSSMVYDDSHVNLGSYRSDLILREIDNLLNDEREEPTLSQIESILAVHIGPSLVDDEHVCLLHQYALNKPAGKSIRGTTKVFDQPHVSTFYTSTTKGKQAESNISPASLTFTGFASKFINLSTKPLNLYWDGGYIASSGPTGDNHIQFVGTIPPFESVGTATQPGHSFFLSATYDKEHVLKRWTITEDEAVLYYDPWSDLSPDAQQAEADTWTSEGKWTETQRFSRDAWIVDRSFGRDYLVQTSRFWLAAFPQPLSHYASEHEEHAISHGEPYLHMWRGNSIGQTFTIETTNLYFKSLPDYLPRLQGGDYEINIESQRKLEMAQYQSSTWRNDEDPGHLESSMELKLKTLSVAPQVFEVRRFLSKVEVKHLIDLASGVKGDVLLNPSTVSSSTSENKKKEAGTSTNGWIHREQDVVVDTIFRRVADLLKIDEHLMRDRVPDDAVEGDSLPTNERIVEAMQLIRHEEGQEYSPRHDFAYPPILNRYQPKRFATILMYLTGADLEGGETVFPKSVTTDNHDGLKIKPQSGKALVYYNVLPDGNTDDLSQHGGSKVRNGAQYLASIWVWDPIIN